MNDEGSSGVAEAATEPSVHHSSLIIHHFPIPRFAFPAVPEPCDCPPTPEASQIVWPKCDNTEMARASAETAEGILRQLPLRRPTVVALTSPGDGDGKTSLLVALAPQLAKRIAGGVLVVDANFQRPTLTSQLNLSVSESDTGQLLIYPTNLQRLSVLPAPPNIPPQPLAAHLSPHQIEELREGWSLVLLDTASLTHPEVAPLARCCDGVYLVARLGHTSQRAVRQSARVIHAAGSRLLGCVVVT
jgi:Mrp family chromosome partitioning ATPase